MELMAKWDHKVQQEKMDLLFYTDTNWQSLSLINGVAQAGSENQPKYRFVSINDTNLLFIKEQLVKSIQNDGVCKVTDEYFTKISSYAEYSKVKINPYMNTSAI